MQRRASAVFAERALFIVSFSGPRPLCFFSVFLCGFAALRENLLWAVNRQAVGSCLFRFRVAVGLVSTAGFLVLDVVCPDSLAVADSA
jgi:hypothetical protein